MMVPLIKLGTKRALADRSMAHQKKSPARTANSKGNRFSHFHLSFILPIEIGSESVSPSPIRVRIKAVRMPTITRIMAIGRVRVPTTP